MGMLLMFSCHITSSSQYNVASIQTGDGGDAGDAFVFCDVIITHIF